MKYTAKQEGTELEKLVDRIGLQNVVGLLICIALEKAETLRNDEYAIHSNEGANEWEKDAVKLQSIIHKLFW